jgi:adenylyltransferase/sulfurtransferase
MCGDKPTITQLIDYEQFCGVRGQEAPAPAARDDGWETTVEELKKRLDRKDDIFILDVRNPPEYAICKLMGSTLIPLPELPQRFGELDKNREMIVHCKSGMRSAKAVQFLRQQGFTKIKNLKGGILAWADKIDPSMPKY